MFNFTILFWPTNVSAAGPLFHMIHMGDAQTVNSNTISVCRPTRSWSGVGSRIYIGLSPQLAESFRRSMSLVQSYTPGICIERPWARLNGRS
jgi:hypothetical protein